MAISGRPFGPHGDPLSFPFPLLSWPLEPGSTPSKGSPSSRSSAALHARLPLRSSDVKCAGRHGSVAGFHVCSDRNTRVSEEPMVMRELRNHIRSLAASRRHTPTS